MNPGYKRLLEATGEVQIMKENPWSEESFGFSITCHLGGGGGTVDVKRYELEDGRLFWTLYIRDGRNDVGLFNLTPEFARKMIAELERFLAEHEEIQALLALSR